MQSYFETRLYRNADVPAKERKKYNKHTQHDTKLH